MTSTIFTIGFTQKSAESFFSLLKTSGVEKLIDVRLNKISQLAGFAKKNDLVYFLGELCGIQYIEAVELAPEKKMLKDYQSKEISWERYADNYLNLISRRKVEKTLPSDILERGCLLCSEHLPHHCHRRLAAEYLRQTTGTNFEIKHLVK